MNPSVEKMIQTLEPNSLSLGSYGSSVQSLQLALEELSYFNGIADGFFGQQTVAAVRQLQKDFDLAETGELNTATWYVLAFWAWPHRQAARRFGRSGFSQCLSQVGQRLRGQAEGRKAINHRPL